MTAFALNPVNKKKMHIPVMSKVFDAVEKSRAIPNGRTPFDREIKVEKSVVYKSVGDTNLVLDVYYPCVPIMKTSPAVMVIPGGGWMIHNRERRDGYAKCFAALGATVFVIDHRLCPQVFFPDNLVDCIDAFNFIVENCKRFGIDPNNITVSGDSSGGHLCACMGCASSNAEYSLKLGLPKLKSKPANLIFISGAFSFDVMYRIPFTHLLIGRYVSGQRSRRSFRKWEYYKEINVYNYVNKDFPESYNNGGGTDPLCMGEAKRMAKRLDCAGVKNEYRIGKNVFNSGHCYVLRFPFSPARRDMLALYTWYVAKQRQKGCDLNVGYERVKRFFTQYKKSLH